MMDVLAQTMDHVHQRLSASFTPSASAYIFPPTSADAVTTGVLLLVLLSCWHVLPWHMLLLVLGLTLHCAATLYYQRLNLAKLAASEELLQPAAAQLQLQKAKAQKLEAVIEELSEVKSAIAAGQQAEKELLPLRDQHEELQKRLLSMENLQAHIHTAHKRLASLPRMQTRLQHLRTRAHVYQRLKWACKLLKAETAKMGELNAEYVRLKETREHMKAVQAGLQSEVSEIIRLEAECQTMQQKTEHAAALRAQIASLRQSDDLASSGTLRDQRQKDALLSGTGAQARKPTDITNTMTALPQPHTNSGTAVHGCEGVIAPASSANSKSKIPHPQDEQKVTPNPVYKEQQATDSSSSSRASSGVASYNTHNTVRNPTYSKDAVPATPSFFTPAGVAFSPGSGFTPGPEAAAFAAALAGNFPLSLSGSQAPGSHQQPQHSGSVSRTAQPQALDFSSRTPNSGAVV